MKIERLVDAIGGIDEELIQAAVNDDAFIMKQKRKKHIITVCIAGAACVCLAVGGFLTHSIISNRYAPDSGELTGISSGVDSVPMGQGFFNARVLEVKTGEILVECTESYDEVIQIGDKLVVSLDTLSDEKVPGVKVGEDLRILYFGEVKEQSDGVLALEKTVSIFMLDEIGATDKQNKKNVDDTPGIGQGYFDAIVLEKHDDHIIVECTEGYQQEVVTGDKLSVSLNTISDEPVPTVQEGDRVRVLYIGELSQTENGMIKPQNIISLFLIDGDGGIG